MHQNSHNFLIHPPYRYLLSGVDLERCNHDGRTPLHVAAAEGMNQ